MNYYICEENGELIFRSVQGFVPKSVILRVEDDSLKDKKLKLIDEPVLDMDGNPQLDIDGNPVTQKKAVVDVEKQALKEAKQLVIQQDREARELSKGTLINEIKNKQKTKGKMTLEETQELLSKVIEHLGLDK